MTIDLSLEFFYPIIAFTGVILATWLIAHFLGRLSERLLRHNSSRVAIQIKRSVWIFVWIMGVLFAIEQLGLRMDLLLLLVGLLGLALIVANRETLKNFASNYFSDLYIPYGIGDSIKVGEHAGTVIEINPICIVILTDKEELISVPNSFFINNITINTTPQAWKKLTIPITISNDIDLAEFEREVLKSCNKLKQHLDERFPPILTVKNRDQKNTDLVLVLMTKEPNIKEVLASSVSLKISEIMEKMKNKKK